MNARGNSMRWFSLGAAALVSFVSAANAADLADRAYTKAPNVAAPYNWTGFYFGGDLGGARSSNTGTFNPIPSVVELGALSAAGNNGGSSFLGGFHVGYNYQIAPTWVVGIEGDSSWTKAKGSFSQAWINPSMGPLPGTNITLSSQLDWMASARGRLGYLVMPNVMAYATGGAAWSKIQYDGSTSCSQFLCTGYSANATPSGIELGYVLGGGLEWMISDNWLVRTEYLSYHFSGGPNVIAQAGAAFARFPSNFLWDATHVNVVRGGVSYKF
jgi:outer membrane immunogenic protein